MIAALPNDYFGNNGKRRKCVKNTDLESFHILKAASSENHNPLTYRPFSPSFLPLSNKFQVLFFVNHPDMSYGYNTWYLATSAMSSFNTDKDGPVNLDQNLYNSSSTLSTKD